MENFLHKKINAETFSDNVFWLRRKSITDSNEIFSNLEKIENFQPDERSIGIGGVLSNLFFECEFYDDYDDFDSLYDYITTRYLKFKEALNKEWSNTSLFIYLY